MTTQNQLTMNTNRLLRAAALAAFTCASAIAADSQYTLFNPTPRDQMRRFSTDATTSTLTPYTVDAGHFQVEADIFDYFYDKGGSTTADGWAFGYSTLKLGLCNSSDLEVTFQSPYEDYVVKNSATGSRKRFSGFGDVGLASKINLWGNDGGTTALALLPLVNFPTGGADTAGYYGGIRAIFAAQLPYEVQLGLKTGFDLFEDAHNIHADFRNSISLQRQLVGQLHGYAEFVTVALEHDGSWSGFGNGGLAYQVTGNLQIHAGVYVDVKNANDYNPYAGFTWRY